LGFHFKHCVHGLIFAALVETIKENRFFLFRIGGEIYFQSDAGRSGTPKSNPHRFSVCKVVLVRRRRGFGEIIEFGLRWRTSGFQYRYLAVFTNAAHRRRFLLLPRVFLSSSSSGFLGTISSRPFAFAPLT
jgi:hypothetical protein